MTEIRWKKVQRQTKIIATLGPATDDKEIIRRLIDAGVDAVRLNFSHGSGEEHLHRARIVREVSESKRYHTGILADLQGPKIRICSFRESAVELHEDQPFILSHEMADDEGTSERVGVTHPHLHRDIKAGDELLLDDGRIALAVESSNEREIRTRVIVGGILSNSKGLNRRGGGLSAPSITAKDKQDIKTAAQMGVDYLAVSFARTAEDVVHARRLLTEAGGNAQIITKIERTQALENIDEILKVSDGVMIARGDLSIEIGDAELTAVQKQLIKKARESDRIVITATEMLQSMIESNVPTRAEISDVANAVLDGSDALMLSAESAIGRYPVEAVKTMSRLCQGAECVETEERLLSRLRGRQVARFDEAIALSVAYTAEHLKVKAIAALTESGASALYMSRVCYSIPIYAMTRHAGTCRKVTLYRGVYPLLLKESDRGLKLNEQVIRGLSTWRTVEQGDNVIITKGETAGLHGGTNGMKIISVP